MSDSFSSNSGGGARVPYSDLDMTFMVTEPAWGKEISEELNSKVSEVVSEAYFQCLECEKPFGEGEKCVCGSVNKRLVVDRAPMWGLLSYYTRDLRLGNLGNWNNELSYCHHYLSLAGDLLRVGNVKSFLSALSRVIDRLEISQSKGGFYRKRMGTITREDVSSSNEPTKKPLMGGKNKNQ